MSILGVHVAKISKVLDNKTSKPLHDAIIRDTDHYALNAAQIYTFGPRNSKMNIFSADKIKKMTHDIDLSVHSAYSTVGVWKATSDDHYSIELFRKQMESCKSINAWGLVLHVSKIPPETVANVMKKYLLNLGFRLLTLLNSKSNPHFL